MKRFISRDPDRLERVPFVQVLPNMVTLAGMCLGLTSIRYSVDERFATALVLIIFAGLMDGLDGLLARRLNATSNFGKELDSLSDFLCFGVAPGVLIYQLHLGPSGSLGWVFVLVFAAAACLRLARFNVMRGLAQEGEAETTTPHFLGVPAPGGAMLALLPAFLTLGGIVDFRHVPLLVALWMGLVGLLMISNLKTISPKALRVPRGAIGLMLFATVIGIGLIFTRPWLLLITLDLIYLTLVLRSVVKARGAIFS